MGLPRFYLPDLTAGNYTFSAEEMRHIAGAKRMRVDDLIEVFDGLGAYQEVRITQLQSRKVLIEPTGDIVLSQRVTPRLEIAVAVPKSKRLQYMIEKLVELGVSKVTPLICSRSVAGGSDPVEKYKRWAIEACKQSRNSWIPEFSQPVEFDEAILSTDLDCPVVMADYTGVNILEFVEESVESCLCLIGPEGGFSQEEFDFAEQHGVVKIRLAPNILRIETAAVAFASSLMSLHM